MPVLNTSWGRIRAWIEVTRAVCSIASCSFTPRPLTLSQASQRVPATVRSRAGRGAGAAGRAGQGRAGQGVEHVANPPVQRRFPGDRVARLARPGLNQWAASLVRATPGPGNLRRWESHLGLRRFRRRIVRRGKVSRAHLCLRDTPDFKPSLGQTGLGSHLCQRLQPVKLLAVQVVQVVQVVQAAEAPCH